MIQTFKNILIPVGIGLGILALLGLFGSSLFLYREASAVHPLLGWLVLTALATSVVLLVFYPIARVLRLPRPLRHPGVSTGPKWDRYLGEYRDRLLSNDRLAGYPEIESLRQASSNETLRGEIDAATEVLHSAANSVIQKHAAAVFVATGASQSGRLDGGIVLSAQIRMIKEIAEIYWQRPGPRELWSLYGNVGGSAFLASEIQDSELLAVLGAPVSAALSGFVPVRGTAPLVSLLVNSLLDGSANALLTLRVGTIARQHCALQAESDRSAIARSASIEAAMLLGGVVAQGSKRIADATRRLVVTGAVRGPQTAVKGVAGVGTALVGGIAKVATKAGGAANKAGNAAFRASQQAARDLSQLVGLEPPPEPETAGPEVATEADLETAAIGETVQFWDRIADVFSSNPGKDERSEEILNRDAGHPTKP